MRVDFAIFVRILVAASPVAYAMQRSRSTWSSVRPPSLKAAEPGVFIELGEAAVKQRGSYCLNGSLPGFLLTWRPKSTKWIIGLQGGGWCNTEEECAYRTLKDQQRPKEHMSITFYSEFRQYNHATIWYCDGGIYSGDREQPVIHRNPQDTSKNVTMYFRGKRIIDHVVHELEKKYGLNRATHVLLTGGSAGGLGVFRIADYVKYLLPGRVYKYAAVPMSGWWSSVGGVRENSDDVQMSAKHSSAQLMKHAFEMHNMWQTTSPSCLKQMQKSKVWQCAYADVSWAHSETPMFIIQVLDMFIAVQNQSKAVDAKDDSYCILKGLHKDACNVDDIYRLNEHVSGILGHLQKAWKYKTKNEGGFFSTCSFHAFYGFEEFWNYAINGVTMAEAVLKWWKSQDGASPQWYLPCRLRYTPPYQCEPTCDFAGSGMAYSTPPPERL